MSESSSDEEIDLAVKEAANCDYLNDLVRTTKTPGLGKPNKPSPLNKESEFEKFLAQRLCLRLDSRIKIVEKAVSVYEEQNEHLVTEGIKLFSDAPVVNELTEIVDVNVPLKRPLAKSDYVNYTERAKDVSVSSEWVKSKDNTVFWKDNKKPRLLAATVINRLTNGSFECQTHGDFS